MYVFFFLLPEKVVPSQDQIVNSSSTKGKCVIIVLVAVFPLEKRVRLFLVHSYMQSTHQWDRPIQSVE